MLKSPLLWKFHLVLTNCLDSGRPRLRFRLRSSDILSSTLAGRTLSNEKRVKSASSLA